MKCGSAVTRRATRSSCLCPKHTRRYSVTIRAAQPRWFDEHDWTAHRPKKPKQVVTFITSEGLVTLSDSRGLASAERQQAAERLPCAPLLSLPTLEEQGICIGQTFLLSATNGRDLSRRIHVLGFCRSIDMLSEAVEDTVLSNGGEIYQRDTQAGGLAERLVMTVALPYLWGLPPAFDTLSAAILHGGGIVHKVSRQWRLGRGE